MGMQEYQTNIVVVHCILRIIVSLWKYHFFCCLRASAKDHLVARKRRIFAGKVHAAAAFSFIQLAQTTNTLFWLQGLEQEARAVKQN